MNKYPVKAIATACAIALATASVPVLAATADKQNTEVSDVWAKASITTTYTLNRHLNPFAIDIDVTDGVATLNGEVETDIERDLAEELALGVAGIQDVKNNLEVRPDALNHLGKRANASDNDDFMRKVEDANLTAKVKFQLLWNRNTSGMTIDVDTQKGVVTLTGSVSSQAEAELASQIAKNTADVLGVESKLKVESKASAATEKLIPDSHDVAQDVSDAWISAKVKASLLYNRNVDAADIDVVTKNGVVTLRGRVDSNFERDQAVAIAREVRGVKGVFAELSSS